MGYRVDASKKKRILIVDDDMDYARRLRDYLNSNELEVELETDSASAISRIRDEKPDLVLIEVDLRGESGLTICKLSRKDYTGAIILLSHRINPTHES